LWCTICIFILWLSPRFGLSGSQGNIGNATTLPQILNKLSDNKLVSNTRYTKKNIVAHPIGTSNQVGRWKTSMTG
jgi:hypothetical protein